MSTFFARSAWQCEEYARYLGDLQEISAAAPALQERFDHIDQLRAAMDHYGVRRAPGKRGKRREIEIEQALRR